MSKHILPGSLHKSTDTWKRLLKTATTLLPVLALMLTVFSAASTHKHNRLSVIPKLSFDWNTRSDGLIGLFVENSGTGPAVIKTFFIENEDLLQRSDAIFSERPNVTHFRPTYFLRNGKKEELLVIDAGRVRDKGALKRLIEEQVVFNIEYCSIYGECWKECSRFSDPGCFKQSPAEDVFAAGFWGRIL